MPITALQKQMPWSATWSNSLTGTSLPRGTPWRSGNSTRTVDAVPIAGAGDSTASFSNTFAPYRIGIPRIVAHTGRRPGG